MNLAAETDAAPDPSGRVPARPTVESDLDAHLARVPVGELTLRYRWLRGRKTSTVDGVVVHAADGSIVDANGRAAEILGLTLEQLLGRTSMDPRWRAVQDDGAPFDGEQHPAMVTLRTGRPMQDVVMGIHEPDGRLTWILVNSAADVHPETGAVAGVTVVFTDVTDRWLDLRRSADSDRQTLTVDGQRDGVVIASAVRDGAGAIKDFCVEYTNRAAVRTLQGAGIDFGIGRRLLELGNTAPRRLLHQWSHVIGTGRPSEAALPFLDGGDDIDLRVTRFADGVLLWVRPMSTVSADDPPVAAVVESVPFVPATGDVPIAVFEATQALLWIQNETDAGRLARDLVVRLGGRVVEADPYDVSTIPVDVTFGDRTPLVPAALVGSAERAALERFLPSFVEHAHRAVSLLRRADRVAEDASIDVLTGLANRRALGRALGRLGPGDTVLMIDLDHFRQFNDAHGAHEGDRVLRAFGQMLRDTTRGIGRACRYGGEEFVVVVDFGSDVTGLLARMHAAWPTYRPRPVTFSTGVALAGDDPSHALAAADRALAKAKRSGRDRIEWAPRGEEAGS